MVTSNYNTGVFMKIGQQIKKARLKSDMTQLELAHKLGYDSMQFVSLFERGLSKVPAPAIVKCCAIFNLSPEKMTRTLVQNYESETYALILTGFEKIKK